MLHGLNYIPGPEYPEYLPPADDVFPAKEQPLPVAVSPTAESPGYITNSEPEMDPEEEDGDDEMSEGDSIDYPTNIGDDDADDEDEEESLDSEEEKEEHLALTVPALALQGSISAFEDFNQTETFKEGETIATPPPSAYRVTARISVRPHIPMPFPSESEVERLLAIPTPPLSPVSPTSYPLPPFLMPLPIFTPLPSPPPIILSRTRISIEGIPEADMPLQKRAHFTTPTGGYEVGESYVATAARQIRPALTVDDSRRAEDRLIGRLRREMRYFRTLSTTYATLVTQIKALQRDVSTLQGQQIDDGDRLTRHIQHDYTLRFQELALLCGRMFPEESDEIERYYGGLPEMIRGNGVKEPNIEYVEASPHISELVSLEVAEIVIPEEEEIEDDNLREKLLNVHLLIANIEALKDNPLHLSKEISIGSTTIHSDISLPDYEDFYFYDDHIKEISSGSTTTHSDISLSKYDSFIFYPSNDQFPPTDRSDFTHEEFANKLAHIISPPEYDCFYFRNLPDQGECISVFNFEIRENLSSTTHVNLPVEDDHSTLLAYVVSIFLAYLTLLHLAGSQPMLKSSYKVEASVIISIQPLVEGVADVVVEIKGTGWSILITFRFSVGFQTPDDLSRSRLGFIEKMGVHG
nr:hypothetical protein [Tanacetum cinerariifolium]